MRVDSGRCHEWTVRQLLQVGAALRTRVAPGPKAAGGRNWPVTGRPTAADGIREGWPTEAGRPARHARAQTRMHKGARQVSADAGGLIAKTALKTRMFHGAGRGTAVCAGGPLKV